LGRDFLLFADGRFAEIGQIGPPVIPRHEGSIVRSKRQVRKLDSFDEAQDRLFADALDANFTTSL
jgi:hypothetical protein